MLKLQDVNTYYGGSHVIQDVSLQVDQAEVVALLGRNGVGKTTTLRSIMGLTQARSGKIMIGDTDTRGWPAHRVACAGVAYVPAERNIFPSLSVEENLRIAARPPEGGGEGWSLDQVYEYFPVLGERRHGGGAKLSGGEQQMLAIGRALMGNPRLLLLDEPSQGLSPILVDNVARIVRNLCQEHNLTMLLVEQNFRVALVMADSHYLMGTKSIIQDQVSSEELAANEDMVKKHLSV